MGTKDRRQREVAEREQLFLKKTRELVCQDGLLQLQMARIAGACDYATGTLYQHFASKEDLLVALLTEGSEERIDLFRRAAEWQAPPRDRMFAFAIADVIFVKRNPEYFRIAQYAQTEVVWSTASKERRTAFLSEMQPAGELALGIVNDAVERGDLELRGATAEEVTLGIWTLVTGTHALVHTEGLLEFFAVTEPYRMMGRNIHRLMNGLGWLPLFDIGDRTLCESYSRRVMNEVFGEQQ
jgi:AcrR family transcriptional regulator